MLRNHFVLRNTMSISFMSDVWKHQSMSSTIALNGMEKSNAFVWFSNTLLYVQCIAISNMSSVPRTPNRQIPPRHST
jgi:hypothetical protein